LDADAAGLVAAVFAAPDDDAPRLVLADHLHEKNDPRGELILIECQLGRRPNPLRREAFRKREAELLKEHGAAWAAPIPEVTRRYRWARGFVAAMSANAKKLAPRAEAIFAAHPIADLELPEANDASLTAIAGADLRALRSLKIIGNASNVAVLVLAAKGLHTLSLSSGAGLAGLPPTLDKLVLAGAAIGDTGVARITKTEHGLKELVLTACGMTDEGVRTLAGAPTSRSLRRLALRANELTDAAVDALAASPNLTALEHLEIGGNDEITDASALLRLPSLRSLHVGQEVSTENLKDPRVRILY
jgi:uncharacterized protein (TIGR02996 family)